MSVDTSPRPKILPPPSPIPDTTDVIDFADTAEAELIIYDCGTAAVGLVHDPCQHSTVHVLCCTCAGCMFDRWSCAQEGEHPGRQWWQSDVIAEQFDPWMRHPYALMLYSLIGIFGLSSRIFEYTLKAFIYLDILMAAGLYWALGHAFS